MEKNIAKLKDHYIICGAGETGLNAIKQFKKSNAEFVVIEKEEKKVNELVEDDILAIQGDSTDGAVLEKARIAYAKGLITTLPSDADNVYTALTARSLNSDLYIVSRAIEENADKNSKKRGLTTPCLPMRSAAAEWQR